MLYIGRNRHHLSVAFLYDPAVNKGSVFKIYVSEQPSVPVMFLDVKYQPHALAFHKFPGKTGGLPTHLQYGVCIFTASLAVTGKLVIVTRFWSINPDETHMFAVGKP